MHAATRAGALEALFARSQPVVRRLYDLFLEIVRESGPVTVIPQKTRIAPQVRMRFAALMLQKDALKGHLVLARHYESERVATFSPRNHVHVFRLRAENDLDGPFPRLMAEAYRAEDLATPLSAVVSAGTMLLTGFGVLRTARRRSIAAQSRPWRESQP